jgi:hypothetical protein
MRDDDVAAMGEYLHGHPSAEVFAADDPSAEGFLASVKNRPSGSGLAMTAARSSP